MKRLLILVVAFAFETAWAADAKPKVTFILMDNLGYGELGVYGGGVLRGAPTSRIDALASEGTRHPLRAIAGRS